MFDTVVELYETLPRHELQPDIFTLSALLTVCKTCNYWEEALSFAEEFSTCHGIEMNTLACNTLIATLGRAGRWQYALQVTYFYILCLSASAFLCDQAKSPVARSHAAAFIAVSERRSRGL